MSSAAARNEGSKPYNGVAEPWTSSLLFYWKNSPLSCSNVKSFNGEYTCRVTDGEREATSKVITVDVQCMYTRNKVIPAISIINYSNLYKIRQQ